MIPDVEETLDPILDPILSKFVNRTPDGRVLMRFGDADLDFDDHFKLFITTKIPNPHYLPEIFIKINIINFTVTFAGKYFINHTTKKIFNNELLNYK